MSPLSNFETKVPRPPDPRQQKPPSGNRRRRGKFSAKKRALLAALVILVLGCASFAPLSALWTVTQSERAEGPGEITSHNPDDLSPQLTHPDPGQDITVTPTIAELPPLQNVSTPTPFSLPELTSILEPASTPTRVTIDPSTSTPTPFPTVTDPPTSTPTSLPTATSPPVATLTPPPTATSQPEINHVIIISIDGLRPDALDLADTPTMDDLKAKGVYCPNAQTVKITYTLPSHASMLSGMLPEKHGILWGLPYIGWPGMNGPTLFNVAHDAGLKTAMVYGKEKLNYLVLPNSVDELYSADVHDPEIKDRAVEYIQAGLPNVLFIHFPDTDRVGHDYGWMSTNQFYAITFVDGLIGEIMAELEGGGYLDSTLLIITADHGGHNFKHGDDSPVDRTIPWLAVGPGVPPGVTLTRNINTYDTAATAAHALKLLIPEGWDGQPVLEIFQ